MDPAPVAHVGCSGAGARAHRDNEVTAGGGDPLRAISASRLAHLAAAVRAGDGHPSHRWTRTWPCRAANASRKGTTSTTGAVMVIEPGPPGEDHTLEANFDGGGVVAGAVSGLRSG